MARQVFEGVKVASFTWGAVGPLVVRYLSDHGATVIHIESGTRPDLTRSAVPYKDSIPGINRAIRFALYHCNTYGISLNLNHPRAMEVATRIIAWSDIVVENFSVGRMEKWGLGYEAIKRIKPNVIMISLSMQGQTGPHAAQPAYGYTLTALTGFTHLCGWPDRSPVQPYAAYTDAIVPRFGAIAVIAALDYRRRTGKGQYLDLSQYESCITFNLAPVVLDYAVNRQEANRMGNRCPHAAPHGVYPCLGEDRWCAIAVFSDEEWEGFCQAISNPEWTKSPRFATLPSRKQNEDELDRLVAESTSRFTPEELMVTMQSHGIAAGTVQNGEDINCDPQLEHRGHFWVLEHPEIGPYKCDSPSFSLSKTPSKPRMPAPCLGEHNEYVYTKILGMSDKEFVELVGEGVFD